MRSMSQPNPCLEITKGFNLGGTARVQDGLVSGSCEDMSDYMTCTKRSKPQFCNGSKFVPAAPEEKQRCRTVKHGSNVIVLRTGAAVSDVVSRVDRPHFLRTGSSTEWALAVPCGRNTCKSDQEPALVQV